MNNRKMDFMWSIVSVILIIIIFFIYFVKVFTLAEISGQITGTLTQGKFIIYNQTSSQRCHIEAYSPSIILRMDDVRAFSAPAPYLINEVLRRNMSLVLGIIPREIETDKEFQLFLLKAKNWPNIEIAQHGNNHDKSDENITEESLIEGNIKIQKTLAVKPVTYIPPYNILPYSSAFSRHFRIISSANGFLKGGDIAEIGATAGTYDYLGDNYTSIESVIENCRKSIERTNICVVTIHPQEYSQAIIHSKTFSAEKFQNFKKLLDELEKLNATFHTFNELVYCQNASFN